MPSRRCYLSDVICCSDDGLWTVYLSRKFRQATRGSPVLHTETDVLIVTL
jgi:hypothetical protein